MDFIELLKTVFLGFVEGVTEWLPISSTGHMILVEEFMSLNVSEEFWSLFLVFVQLGAILSVCILYFGELNPFSLKKDKSQKRSTWHLWGKIVVGCIPAAVVGIPLDDFMEAYFYNAYVVSAALIVYGIAFIIIENWRKSRLKRILLEGEVIPGVSILANDDAPQAREKHNQDGAHFKGVQPNNTVQPQALTQVDLNADFGKIHTVEDLSYKTAFGIGCFQILSLIPGTSRSGSTIIGGLLLGTTRSAASKFTFFLAIPVMVGASLLRAVKFFLEGNVLSANEITILAVGTFVAFIVSLFAIKWLVGFVRRHDFKPFGWYRIVLGIAVLIYFTLVG